MFYGSILEDYKQLTYDFAFMVTATRRFPEFLERALSIISDEVSIEAIDFIKQLLQRAPKDRMTLEQAMKHSWIMNSNPSDVTLQKGLAAHKKRNPLLLKNL